MCGLVSFLAKKDQEVNINRFKLIFKSIESRGDQSVGMASDTKFNKEIGDVSNFMTKSDFSVFSEAKILLAHNRRPSVGTVKTISATQPVLFEGAEWDTDGITLAHNGTITNADIVAKKYNLAFDVNETDSQILTRLINKLGYSVLNELIGTATIIWFYDIYPETMYVYKSKLNDDRPLFVMETDEGLYFSSTEESLEIASNTLDEYSSIADIEYNHVYCYKNGIFDNKNKIVHPDRTVKKYPNYGAGTKKAYSGYGKNKVWGYNSDTRKYEYMDKESKHDNDTDKLSTQLSLLNSSVKMYNINSDLPIYKHKNNLMESPHLEKINANSADPESLMYYRGRYWVDGDLANGTMYFDSNYKRTYVQESIFTPSFFNGFLLSSDVFLISCKLSIIEKGLTFGTKSFADTLQRFTRQPIPYVVDGIIAYVVQGNPDNYIYLPIGINNLKYEFAYGYHCNTMLYTYGDIKKGDLLTIYGKEETFTVVNIFDNRISCKGDEENLLFSFQDYEIESLLSADEESDDFAAFETDDNVKMLAEEIYESLEYYGTEVFMIPDSKARTEMSDAINGNMEIIKKYI